MYASRVTPYPVSLEPIAVPLKMKRVHHVGNGESWRSIAMHYYGNSREARRLQMQNGGSLTPGRVIDIP